MHPYCEIAEAENSRACFSVCVLNEMACLRHSITQRHAEHAGFVFKYSYSLAQICSQVLKFGTD